MLVSRYNVYRRTHYYYLKVIIVRTYILDLDLVLSSAAPQHSALDPDRAPIRTHYDQHCAQTDREL